MASRQSSRPTLLAILGAGFSAGFGLPISNGLKEYVSKPCESPSSGLFEEVPSLYEEAIREYPVRELLKKKGAVVDIEHFLSIWPGYCEQVYAASGRRTGNFKSIYRGIIERVCSHLYALSWQAAHADSNSFGRFDAFASWLKDTANNYDVRFVTFNYDIVLELACNAAGLGFEYFDEHSRNAPNDRILIRKLHGSVNWQEFPGESASPNSEMNYLHHSNGSWVYSFPTVTKCPYSASGTIPVIIPPAANKTYNELFRWCLCLAAGDIRAADRVLIVGYSFPGIDAFARIHLARLLESKHEIKCVCKTPDRDDLANLLRLEGDQVVDQYWELEHFNWLSKHD